MELYKMTLYTWLKNWWNNTELKIENKYGWIPDHPDARDHEFLSDVMPVQILPPKVDLSPQMPDTVFDQQSLGSCTANAIAMAVWFDLKKQNLGDYPPSRLFIYYNERDMEGTINSDSGAMIRDGIKSINSIGVCHESLWPYTIPQFTWKPSAEAYVDALKTHSVSYKRIYNAISPSLMKLCLANGIPFVLGFTVYQSFETQAVANTGIVPMPNLQTESILGGHAVLCVGYDDSTKMFKCRNSWGANWGDHGYFYMPYEYLTNTNLADDFWAIQVMT